jgi:uncharacterized oxidoreductase
VEPLQNLVKEIFIAAGCRPGEGKRIAKYLMRANLTGHDSHGIIRVPRYLVWKAQGTVVANQKLAIINESESLAVVDGQHGFGQSIGPQAVDLGIEKAKNAKIAIIALRHSGHLGRIGEWAERAAAAGLVSIHFVNVAGSQLVAPFGGVDRRLSTAPFSVGIPVAHRPPVILDFATSVVAEGKVLVAAFGGKPLPERSLIEPDGTMSQNPLTLYGGHRPFDPRKGPGAIRAMGEHKGSGLALTCEFLGGALTGSGCAGPGERRISNGMLSIYMEPEAFAAEGAFAAEVKSYIDFFTSSRPASAGGEVLLPGDPERRNKEQRLKEGVPLSDEALLAILDAARTVGVAAEKIAAVPAPAA